MKQWLTDQWKTPDAVSLVVRWLIGLFMLALGGYGWLIITEYKVGVLRADLHALELRVDRHAATSEPWKRRIAVLEAAANK